MNSELQTRIEEICSTRSINYLMHFTKLANLDSILSQGLVPRNHLASTVGCNDELRLDGTDAICASIEFPNYQMFYKLRNGDANVLWVILVIAAELLGKTRVAFCKCNAASASVTNIPIADRMSAQAFSAMFEDFEEVKRANLEIDDKLTTNPQAEVLFLDGVPRDAILGVLVEREEIKVLIKIAYPDLAVETIPGYFSPRNDYRHWKKVVGNG